MHRSNSALATALSFRHTHLQPPSSSLRRLHRPASFSQHPQASSHTMSYQQLAIFHQPSNIGHQLYTATSCSIRVDTHNVTHQHSEPASSQCLDFGAADARGAFVCSSFQVVSARPHCVPRPTQRLQYARHRPVERHSLSPSSNPFSKSINKAPTKKRFVPLLHNVILSQL